MENTFPLGKKDSHFVCQISGTKTDATFHSQTAFGWKSLKEQLITPGLSAAHYLIAQKASSSIPTVFTVLANIGYWLEGMN